MRAEGEFSLDSVDAAGAEGAPSRGGDALRATTTAFSRILTVCSLVVAGAWLLTLMQPDTFFDGPETVVARMIEAVRAGGALYPPIGGGTSVVVDPYPPMFPWIASALVPLVGDVTMAGRIVSLAATAGVLALVVRRSGRNGWPTLVLLASFPVLRWAAALRPDALALLVEAAGLLLILRRRGATQAAWQDYAGGALLGIALATKHSMLGLPLGLALSLVVAPSERRRVLRIAAGAAVTAVACAAAYLHAYPGMARHLVDGPRGELSLAFGLNVVAFSLVPGLPFFLASSRRSDDLERGDERFLRALLAGALGWALLASFKSGSDSNYYLEAYLVAAVMIVRRPLEPASGGSVASRRRSLGALAGRFRTWWLAVPVVFTAINVALEAPAVVRTRRSQAAVETLLDRVAHGDPRFFSSRGFLLNFPADVSLRYPPPRVDFYVGELENAGIVSLDGVRGAFCAADPRVLVSRYDMHSSRQDYRRRQYLGRRFESLLSCAPYEYVCPAHHVYSSIALDELPEGCSGLASADVGPSRRAGQTTASPRASLNVMSSPTTAAHAK